MDQFQAKTNEHLAQMNELAILQKNVSHLEEYAKDSTILESEKDGVKSIFDYIENIIFPALFAQTKRMLLDPTVWKADLINMALVRAEIREAQAQISLKTIQLGDLCEAELAVLKTEKLADVWQELQKSQKLAQESQQTIDDLNVKMGVMKKLCDKIKKMITEHEESGDERTKEKIRDRIRLKYIRLDNDYIEAKSTINILRSRVDEQLSSLKTYEQVERNVKEQNITMAFVNMFKGFGIVDDDLAEQQSMQNAFRHFSNANDGERAIKSIGVQKKVFEEIMQQINALEERLAQIHEVKKNAEQFLLQYFTKEELKKYKSE